MSEDEKQEAFREEVRGFLAKDKAVLDNLVSRVDKLEKTVVHGNGTPPLVTQFAAMQAKLEVLSTEFSEMKTKIGSIDELRTDFANLHSDVVSLKESKASWFQAALIIITVIGTPIVTKLLNSMGR